MYENIPTIRGISAATGLTMVPAPWLQSIQINKGAGSVVNGYESITGQINLEFYKPQLNTEKALYGDIFVNSMGRFMTSFILVLIKF